MYRSFLFVPANDERRVAKVHERGADAIILDLEDAVAADAKEAARAAVPAIAAALAAKGATVFVRVNADWRADIGVAQSPGVSGIVAPKVRDVEGAREIVAAVRSGMDFIALIETAAGLYEAAAIAAVDGVSGLALGSEDLSVELGVAPNADSLDLPCKMLALAAATRGLMALGAPVSIGEFRDLETYTAAVALARRIGMTGAFCIHPAQVPIVNQGFAPSEAEIEDARTILAAWESGGGRGVVAHAGRMIDAPVIARARRLLGKETA